MRCNVTCHRITAYQRHIDRLEAEIHRRLSNVRFTRAVSVALNVTLLVALATAH